MTNLDIHPEEIVCGGAEPIVAELLAPRDVPLGRPRAVKCAEPAATTEQPLRRLVLPGALRPRTCLRKRGDARGPAPLPAPALPTVRMRPCG